MQSVAVQGAQLEYYLHGPTPEEAPTLVFLHEGLGCAAQWRDFPNLLADAVGCGALVYSRQGYGGSDPCKLPRPLSYMHDEALQVLPQILNALAIRDHLLIGHSDGGSIALINAAAVAAPGLLGVVTESAHVFCEDLSVRSISAARDAFVCGDLAAGLHKYHGSNTECAFWGWNQAWLDPEFMAWNVESFLPHIRVPILALQGKEDHYGTLAQLEAIQKGCGHYAKTQLIEQCMHTPHREQSEKTLALMSGFIQKLLSR